MSGGGYKIPPAELLHVDDTNVGCPKCKQEGAHPTNECAMD